MPPYEALYGRKCRSPLHWDEAGEKAVVGPELIHEAVEKIHGIKQRMKAAQIGTRVMLIREDGLWSFKLGIMSF